MIQYLKKKLTKLLRLKRQEEWLINLNGDILHTTTPNWFERYILRKHVVINIYTPKKPYNEKEQAKLGKLVALTMGDTAYTASTALTIVNAIRPNTFEKSIADAEASPYYQTLL
jgi:hypothetical protein